MLDLSISAKVGKQYSGKVRSLLRRAHGKLNPKLRELSIAFVSDSTMRKLHFQFMGIDAPTDVLTFPLEQDSSGRTTSGEVVVCVPQARREAKTRGSDVRNEVLLYALHGMLHLCGFDDRTDRGYRRMHRIEDQILTQLGVGPVFNHSPAKSRRPTVRNPGRRKRGRTP